MFWKREKKPRFLCFHCLFLLAASFWAHPVWQWWGRFLGGGCFPVLENGAHFPSSSQCVHYSKITAHEIWKYMYVRVCSTTYLIRAAMKGSLKTRGVSWCIDGQTACLLLLFRSPAENTGFLFTCTSSVFKHLVNFLWLLDQTWI